MECLWSLTRRDEQNYRFHAPPSSSSGRQPKLPTTAFDPSESVLPARGSATWNSSSANHRNAVILPLDPRQDVTASASSSSGDSNNSDNSSEEDDEGFAAFLERDCFE